MASPGNIGLNSPRGSLQTAKVDCSGRKLAQPAMHPQFAIFGSTTFRSVETGGNTLRTCIRSLLDRPTTCLIRQNLQMHRSIKPGRRYRMTYLFLKYLHVLGAVVILGTGSGIAYFMLMAHRTGDTKFIAGTAHVVVIADWIFTATAVAAQPVTGYLLLRQSGWSLSEFWIKASIVLYVVAGVFWLPVVGIQRRMRDLAHNAAEAGAALPEAYHRLFRIWFIFGFPGFGAVMAILWLMIAKPDIGI